MAADRDCGQAANRLQHKMAKSDVKLIKGVTTSECPLKNTFYSKGILF